MPPVNKTSALRIIIAAFAAVAAAVTAPFAQGAQPLLSSAFALPAAYVSYSIRDGYRKYDGVDGFQHIPEDKKAFMFGGGFGKRFALGNQRLRLYAAAEAGWGTVREEVFEAPLRDRNGELVYLPVSLNSNYLTGGVLTEAHYLFPSYDRTFFLSAGPGLHLTRYDITTTVEGKLLGTDSKSWTPSVSFNIGAATEYWIDRRKAVLIGYNLRVWQPVQYIDVSIFPMGVDFREVFVSHTAQIQLILPKRFFDKLER